MGLMMGPFPFLHLKRRATDAELADDGADDGAVSFFGDETDTAAANADAADDGAVSFFDPDPPIAEPDRSTQARNGAVAFLEEDNNDATPESVESSPSPQEEPVGSLWGEDDFADNVDFGEETVSSEPDLSSPHSDFSPPSPDNTLDAFTADELEALAEDLHEDPLDAFTQDELAELAKSQQPQPLSMTAIAIAISACAALSVLGGLYLYRGRLFPQTAQPEASPSQAASPTSQPKPSPTTSPTTKPSPSPVASRHRLTLNLHPRLHPRPNPRRKPTTKPTTKPSPSPVASPSAKPQPAPNDFACPQTQCLTSGIAIPLRPILSKKR